MNPIDFILHIDQHLLSFLHLYGSGFYAIVFAIVFIETGLIFMPFLPGDSLLFASGALAATGAINITWLLSLLILAALLGDNLNYAVGRQLGRRWLAHPPRWLRRKDLDKTRQYFDTYGGKTVLIARFLPIFRTFTPFVVGMAHMPYRRFFAYDLVGGLTWVLSFGLMGFGFGNLPVVKHYFTLCILGIIVLSLLPAVWRFTLAKQDSEATKT